MKDDLPAEIEKWLQKEGFPFEMRVAQSFREAGFGITQADYYTDPETHVAREIDVVATIQRSIRDGLILRIIFVVECKSSTDKPWLLFCAPEVYLPPPALITQRLTSRIGLSVFSNVARNKDLQKLAIFAVRDPVGYSLRQAFTKEKDYAYAATCSVVNAARGTSLRWIDHPSEDRILEIIFPVIAIDGRLFQCSLEKTGKISISETASATLLWRNALPPLSETIIDLQTPSSLAGFAKQSFLAADAFLTSYYTLVQETLAQIKERERREFKFADNTPLRHPK